MKCTVIERRIEGDDSRECCSYGLSIEYKSDAYIVNDISVNEKVVQSIADLIEITEPDIDKVYQILEAVIP